MFSTTSSNNNNNLNSNTYIQKTNLISREELDYIQSHQIHFPSSINNNNSTTTTDEQEQHEEWLNEIVQTLTFHYTELISKQMMSLFYPKYQHFLQCLFIPGIGTRFEQFYNFLEFCSFEEKETWTHQEAFEAFANHLGRVRTYRALALKESEYQKIISDDSIHPTGRLKISKEIVEGMVDLHGVWKICHARLYIGQRMVKYDPSLSLHDHPETTTCIASHYMDLPERKIYLMELDLPLIEVLGYKVRDVAYDRNRRWFYYGKIWFDSFDETTERYTLFEIPLLSKRMTSLRIFDNQQDIENFLRPFRESQQLLKNQCDDQSEE